MSVIAIIPARMESSRFPGKPLADLNGFPMIGHVYKRAKMCKALDEVYVATCNEEICNFIESIGGKAIMTSNSHERCTDRTDEAVNKIEESEGKKVSVVVMIQGDEPMITPEMIELSVGPVVADSEIVKCVNLMSPLKTQEEHEDPNEVKVVFNLNKEAIYFSREPIPSRKKGADIVPMWKQVCIITFEREFLDQYSKMAPTPLEVIESVDMNRILEHGYKIKMVESYTDSYAVDTPGDLSLVADKMKSDELVKEYFNG